MREARLAARIEHVNVVPIYGAGEDAGRLFIAMRFIDGIDLESALSQGGLAAPEAARIVASVADALDAAHALGLVHRDVKPANILLDVAGGGTRVFLTDFGVAVERGAQGLLARDGAWVGTPGYAAPEHIRDAVVDARTDVYALGACSTTA